MMTNEREIKVSVGRRFLPERFDKVMKKIRSDEKDRLKRLGIAE